MLNLDIPGFGKMELEHAVFDYNGTLAVDGKLIQGITERLEKLSQILVVHVVTADTFGLAAKETKKFPCRLHILEKNQEETQKLDYIKKLNKIKTAAVGNGANDRMMLKQARLGIAVTGPEGAAQETCRAADIIVPDIAAAINLLLNPKRIKATLRC